MKKLMLLLIVLLQLGVTIPSYAFIDYLFSGNASRDAIDNSALGDLRAWWTGNPGYQFNPFWSGQSSPVPSGGQAPGGSYGPQAPYPQYPQPSASYMPPQAAPGGYAQPMPQAGQPVGVQQYQTAPQTYQPMPQGYQAAPQGYQMAPQTFQTAPQAYQQAAPQMMQQPATQAYPGMVGGQAMSPGGYGQQ